MVPRPDRVVVISDGHGPEAPQALFKRAQAVELRIFCLGVGPDPGAGLLEGLGAAGGGTTELVAGDARELSKASCRIAADLQAEPTELRLEALEDISAWERWPQQVVVYPERLGVAYLRRRGAPTEAQARGLRVNGTAVPVTPGSFAAGRRLHYLGARRRLVELDRFNAEGKHDEAILALGVEQGLACSQTAFVAVEAEDVEVATLQALGRAAVERALRLLLPTGSALYRGAGASVTLALLEEVGPGRFRGRWISGDEAVDVVVTIEGGVLTVLSAEKQGAQIMWRGTLDQASGAFTGRSPEGSGSLELRPVPWDAGTAAASGDSGGDDAPEGPGRSAGRSYGGKSSRMMRKSSGSAGGWGLFGCGACCDVVARFEPEEVVERVEPTEVVRGGRVDALKSDAGGYEL